MTSKITDDGTVMVLDPETISMLQAIFKFSGKEENEPAIEEGIPKTASVKFMITMQDEKDLRNLGYSQEQIHKMKPQEARDILQSGTKAVQDLLD
jgi:hypothetical protein